MEKYTERERWQIGKWVYEGKYTVAEAAEEFGVNFYTARDYLRKYKAHLKALENSIQEKNGSSSVEETYEGLLRRHYSQMDKDELIEELIREKCK